MIDGPDLSQHASLWRQIHAAADWLSERMHKPDGVSIEAPATPALLPCPCMTGGCGCSACAGGGRGA